MTVVRVRRPRVVAPIASGQVVPRDRAPSRSSSGAGSRMQTSGSGSWSSRAYAARMPAACRASVPSCRRPHTATTGTPAAAARRATPTGALPRRLCSSSDPSPVTTSALPGSCSSNPTRSSISSIPGRSVGAEHRQRREANTPGSSRARRGPHVGPDAVGHDVGPVGQGGVEHGHVLGAGALLRSVDGCRPRGAQQRVVHVARHDEPGLRHGRVDPREVQLGQRRQGPAAGSESGAGRVEQSGAERLQQTGAAVSAGTAPDPEHDLVAASVERGQHGLTHSTRRGGQRRQLAHRAAAPGRTRRPSRRRPPALGARTPSPRARRSARTP